jgi:DMSO/TMAO reductase YedYZ heme-binding membrane subunit
MKLYFSLIKLTQQTLMTISVILLVVLPNILALYPEAISTSLLYALAHSSLFLVMIIRPLADLLPQAKFIRPLVILRKGVGVFSSSIIVSFIISKIMIDPTSYLSSFGTLSYWSFGNLALFAHLADISALLLLITSNNFSKKIMGANWKRLQRLSYVYFYGSGIYIVGSFGDQVVFTYMIVVTVLTLLAYFSNKQRAALTQS